MCILISVRIRCRCNSRRSNSSSRCRLPHRLRAQRYSLMLRKAGAQLLQCQRDRWLMLAGLLLATAQSVESLNGLRRSQKLLMIERLPRGDEHAIVLRLRGRTDLLHHPYHVGSDSERESAALCSGTAPQSAGFNDRLASLLRRRKAKEASRWRSRRSAPLCRVTGLLS